MPIIKAGDSKPSFRLHNRSRRTSGLTDTGRDVVPGGQDQARQEGSQIAADHLNNVRVEPIGGRRQFHGANEAYLSGHFDAHTSECECVVHSFKNYTKLENVGAEDYFFCRFDYKAANWAFTPDRVGLACFLSFFFFLFLILALL
ncbi:unnamed protein product [Musa hybrid cultivar]